MDIEVYTRYSCTRCVLLKEILRKENVEYKEYIIDENITREEVQQKFPNQVMLPICVYKSVTLADSDQLVKIIMEKKYEKRSTSQTTLEQPCECHVHKED